MSNDIAVDWLSLGTWFSTFSAPGARILARGSVYLLLPEQINWFDMANVFCAKRGIESGWKLVLKNMKCTIAIKYERALLWVSHLCGLFSHPKMISIVSFIGTFINYEITSTEII